ncbi:612_t:CDS:2, partial [Acaulospora colombiana]
GAQWEREAEGEKGEKHREQHEDRGAGDRYLDSAGCVESWERPAKSCTANDGTLDFLEWLATVDSKVKQAFNGALSLYGGALGLEGVGEFELSVNLPRLMSLFNQKPKSRPTLPSLKRKLTRSTLTDSLLGASGKSIGPPWGNLVRKKVIALLYENTVFPEKWYHGDPGGADKEQAIAMLEHLRAGDNGQLPEELVVCFKPGPCPRLPPKTKDEEVEETMAQPAQPAQTRKKPVYEELSDKEDDGTSAKKVSIHYHTTGFLHDSHFSQTTSVASPPGEQAATMPAPVTLPVPDKSAAGSDTPGKKSVAWSSTVPGGETGGESFESRTRKPGAASSRTRRNHPGDAATDTGMAKDPITEPNSLDDESTSGRNSAKSTSKKAGTQPQGNRKQGRGGKESQEDKPADTEGVSPEDTRRKLRSQQAQALRKPEGESAPGKKVSSQKRKADELLHDDSAAPKADRMRGAAKGIRNKRQKTKID